MLWVDAYRPLPCYVLGTLGGALSAVVRPRPEPGRRAAHLPAVAAVVSALALLVVCGAFRSEHLLTDRDPGAYVNAGRSIAREQALRSHPYVGPFADRRAFSQGSAGVVAPRTDYVVPNFLHFLPVLLALGWSAGGDNGLLLVPAILGALGLLALYALASTVVGPRWALLPPLLLGLAPLQSWFARDAYSELPTQLLALAGLWAFVHACRRGSGGLAVVAGFLLGTTLLPRVDSPVLFVGLPLALAVLWERTDEADSGTRGPRRLAIGTFTVTLALTAYVADRLTRKLSYGYVWANWSSTRGLWWALLGSTAVAVVGLVVHRIRPGIGRRIVRSPVVLGVGIAAYVAVVVWTYALRPDPMGDRPHLARIWPRASRSPPCSATRRRCGTGATRFAGWSGTSASPPSCSPQPVSCCSAFAPSTARRRRRS
jgi:hypothetical protein